jgi:hypothetical protein
MRVYSHEELILLASRLRSGPPFQDADALMTRVADILDHMADTLPWDKVERPELTLPEAMIRASMYYLTVGLPHDYDTWSMEDILDYMYDYACDQVEQYDAERIFEEIECLAHEFLKFANGE